MRVVLAVVALLLTAGCVGVSDTDELAPTAETDYPPGVTADGLQNATRLLEAHTMHARSAGYEFEFERVARTVPENATEPADLRRTRCEGRRTTSALERECLTTERTNGADQQQSRSQTHVWANQSVRLAREHSDGDVSYSLRRSQLDTYTDVETARTLQPMFEGTYHVDRRIVVDGRTLVVLVDDGSTFSTLTGNATMESRLVVDTAGRIHELDATVRQRQDGETLTRSFSYDLTGLGVDEVPAPDWRDAAYDIEAISLDTDGGTYLLTVSHQSGVPIPANSTLRISHEGRVTEFTLDEPVGRYGTLAVAFRTSDLRPVLVDADDFDKRGHVGVEGTYRVELVAPDGTRLLDGGTTVEMAFTKRNPHR